MKKILFYPLSFVVAAIAGCSNTDPCESAKAEVVKYFSQYMNAMLQGQKGASVPGGAESAAALEVAKQKCGKPNLTIEEIMKEKK